VIQHIVNKNVTFSVSQSHHSLVIRSLGACVYYTAVPDYASRVLPFQLLAAHKDPTCIHK